MIHPSHTHPTEVFDFSKDQMTTAKIRTMKESLNEEFSKIFQLCDFILARSQRASLIKATLQTLQRFLTWIPLGFIFETSLIQSLVEQFFAVPAFRVETLECLTEIASLQVSRSASQSGMRLVLCGGADGWTDGWLIRCIISWLIAPSPPAAC